MPWRVIISARAAREMDRLPERDRDATLEALKRFADDPATGDLRKLGGRAGIWRLRVGRWRVLMRLDNATGAAEVQRVVDRKDAY